MAEQVIEGRVIQKIATVAEWSASTLPLKKGEFAIVSDSTGKPINIRVGNGTLPFSGLVDMFDNIQQNVNFIAVSSNALPTPTIDTGYTLVSEGSYTFGGSPAFTVPAGHWGTANWDGNSWSFTDLGELPAVDVSNKLDRGGYTGNASDLATKIELATTNAKITNVNDAVFATTTVNTWLEFGINSGGGINSNANESHTEKIPAKKGARLTSSNGNMYRINIFDSSGIFIAQTPFLGGNDYTLPDNDRIAFFQASAVAPFASNPRVITVLQNNIKSVESISANNSTRITALETGLSSSNTRINSKQNIIDPDAAKVDYSSYVVNGSMNNNGTITAQALRRSIDRMPIELGVNVFLNNELDLTSSKNVVIFNPDLSVKRFFSVVDMRNWKYTPLEGEAFISITIISLNGEVNASRFSELRVYKSASERPTVNAINGFPLAGSGGSGSGAIDVVKVNNVPLPIDIDKSVNITIPEYTGATATEQGFMTPQMYSYLYSLNPAPINIEGSGIAKNASSFGFLPTNNADQNVAALKAALVGGGIILIDLPGVYDMNETITIPSNTLLWWGANSFYNTVSFNGKTPRYRFINEGAYTKTYNSNIHIKGLKIFGNGIGNGSDGTPGILGLRGYVAMFYVKGITVEDFQLLDGDAVSYVLHFCTVEDLRVINPRIEGLKDAVHLGKCKRFYIEGVFKTYDDPIALNAHDYIDGNPELGWIEDGEVVNCYDLADVSTVGYFARILAGSWLDWFSGMEIRRGDTVVSEGRMYRSNNASNGTTYTSITRPTHTSGTQTLDGIIWVMYQDNDVIYNCGVRNVTFRNIHLKKDRPDGFNFHFDNTNFSRSYYPGSIAPVQEGFLFDNIIMEGNVPTLINAITPLDNVKVVNSRLKNTRILLRKGTSAGLTYPETKVLLMGNTYKLTANQILINSQLDGVRAKILGSIKQGNFNVTFTNVTLDSNDL